MKSSDIHTDEFRKKRDEYRQAIKREQHQESVRQMARRRAVREKKEAKERELAALNRPKRALPAEVRRRRKRPVKLCIEFTRSKKYVTR